MCDQINIFHKKSHKISVQHFSILAKLASLLLVTLNTSLPVHLAAQQILLLHNCRSSKWKVVRLLPSVPWLMLIINNPDIESFST